MQKKDQKDQKTLQEELLRLKELIQQQQKEIKNLKQENQALRQDNEKLQENFIKVKDSFSKELLERSNFQSETDNNESIRNNHIDIFNDLKHSKFEEQSMRNLKLHTSNVKDEIKNNLSFNGNQEEKVIYSVNISEFKKSGSLTRKKLTNCGIKNTKYDEFIDNLLLRDKQDKIDYLMDLCAPKKQDKQKLKKQKSLSQSTSNSFLKVKKNDVQQSQFHKTRSSKIFEKSSHNYDLYVKIENLKNDYSKLVNEFYIIDCPKQKLKSYIDGQHLDFQISYSSNPKSNVLTDEKIKFFTPFEKKIRHICVENKVAELNINLFSDDLQNDSQQFFCVALNSKQQDDYSEEELKLITEQFPILQKTNSDAYHYFYVLEIEDFWVDETDTITLNKFINFYCHPKYYVFQTFYPFTVLFKNLLTTYTQQIKKKRLEKFIKIITKDQVDLPTMSRIDSFNMLNQEIELFNSFKQKLFDIVIDNEIDDDNKQALSLSIQKQTIDYVIPDQKFLQYVEAELDFINLLKFFTYEEFLFIYLNLVQEKNVVFVSKDSERLSAAISTFSCLLKPFQWPFPKIYSLPKDCLMMISSPVPVLIGLRAKEDLVLKDIIPSYGNVQDNEIIYVFLDNSLIYYNLEKLQEIVIPIYDDFVPKLKKLYQKFFNKKNSNFIRINKNKVNGEVTYIFKKRNTDTLRENFLRLSKGVQLKKTNRIFSGFKLPSMKNSDKEDPRQFFYFFQYFFNQILIQKLPRDRKLLLRDSEEYINKIDLQFFSKSSQDVKFLENFVQSQIFVYFLEKNFIKELQLIQKEIKLKNYLYFLLQFKFKK